MFLIPNGLTTGLCTALFESPFCESTHVVVPLAAALVALEAALVALAELVVVVAAEEP